LSSLVNQKVHKKDNIDANTQYDVRKVKIMSENELTATARPNWTEIKTTPKKAVNITRKSNLSIFQM